MFRLLAALAIALSLSTPALAACRGSDLRETLSEQDSAAIKAEAAQAPYASGNHWIAQRDGKTLHLIGTMHLTDPRLDAPFARLRPIVETADRLLLEMTATEQAELEAAMARRMDLLILQGTSIPELLDDGEWAMLSEAMQARGMPPVMAAKMQPWYVSMVLGIPPCLQSALAAPAGLDKKLEAAADAAGVPTTALEPFDTVFSAFGSVPLETQITMLLSGLTEPQVNEDLFETMLAGYFDEDHFAIQEVIELLSARLSPLSPDEVAQIFALVDDLLLERRNRAWIPVILETVEASDGPVVAAFGAAHLGGEVGVLNLLAGHGFTLTRAKF